VHIKFPVEFIHTPGVEKNQRDKDIDRTLLGKPEAKLVATNTDGIKLIDQDYPKKVGHDKPDSEAKCHQFQVCFPVRFSVVFITHDRPLTYAKFSISIVR
jgi:hypothetical protein